MNNKRYNLLKRFFSYIRPFKKGIIGAWILLLANILMQLPMPLLTMYLIDNVVASKNIKILNILCIALFFFLLIQLSTSFIQKKIIIKIQNKIVTNIRSNICEKLLKSSLKYFDKVKTGDLITRITSDVGKLQGLLANTIVSILTDGLSLIVGTVVLFFLHWKLALISIAVVPLYLVSIKYFSSRLRKMSSNVQEKFSTLTGALFESFLSIYFVKSFSTENVEVERIDKALENTYIARTKSDTLNSLTGIIAGYISAVGKFILIWYGLTEIINGNLTIGGFLAFNSFLRYIYDPSKNLMSLNTTIQQSMASLERVYELIDNAVKSEEKDGTIVVKDIKGKLTFRDVSFAYDLSRGMVLKDINFNIEPSTVVAIVGPNGSGKTTLINLILRLYNPNTGVIELDGNDITSFRGSTFRSKIGFVPQDIYLLSNTIAYNISYGTDPKSEEEIINASKMAEAHEFIMKLPKAYMTMVGEKGIRHNFSGGEKQRLSIARAFLKNPKMLIFDEATSSIDNESSYYIRKAMSKLMKNRTSFIIAHRMSTVINADYIIVLDKGRIVQSGLHNKLIKEDGLYKILYEKEFFQEDQ
jgi:subfamily B ATP-binding cassette protein MsbA